MFASSDVNSWPPCSRRPTLRPFHTGRATAHEGALPCVNHSRFTHGDIKLLLQFAAAVSKVVENLQLWISSSPAPPNTKRDDLPRISTMPRSSRILGLRLGLEAIAGIAARPAPLSQKILDLVEMANATVRDFAVHCAGFEGTGFRAASRGRT